MSSHQRSTAGSPKFVSIRQSTISVSRITYHAIRLTSILLAAYLFLACNATPQPPHFSSGQLDVRPLRRSITAGQPVTIAVTASDLPNGTPVTLTAVGSFGAHPYRGTVANDKATFSLSSDDTRHSGLVTLLATAGNARAEAELTIRPGPAELTIPAWIGPRAITANGIERTMVVAFPVDRLGNPVAEGTEVTVRVQRPAPGSSISTPPETIKARTEKLLTWVRLNSGVIAGRSRVAVSAGQAHSAEQSFMQVPGRPTAFTITTERVRLPADGRQLVELTTSSISDKYGNPMPDGVSVTFLVNGPNDRTRTIPAATIDGRARAVLQAPTQPGQMTVQAMLADVLSKPLTLTFTEGAAVEAVIVEVTLTPDTVEITAGPLVGSIGQHIADGTTVNFELIGSDGARRNITAPSIEGYAAITLRRALLSSGAHIALVKVGAEQGQISFLVD